MCSSHLREIYCRQLTNSRQNPGHVFTLRAHINIPTLVTLRVSCGLFEAVVIPHVHGLPCRSELQTPGLNLFHFDSHRCDHSILIGPKQSPDTRISVPRFLSVEVSGLNEKGEAVTWQASGWPARILQHEMDHLDGVLYIDRMDSRTFINIKWQEHNE
ncbi:hypothetical protein JOB18_020339 [Solea senegalensis]|uniref:Peptide deformylase n=1 Tax=Solea senegalensis TaxID=28829 RepID=A0AAV6SYK4_SOLSE|nr:hypothetical protein JOB18_020339 [Solea senegalensis]